MSAPGDSAPATYDSSSDSDTSPESAALARGAAASAKHGVRATASGSIGRLPVASPTAPTIPPLTKPHLSRSLPRARSAVKPSTTARVAKSSRGRVGGAPRANQSIAKATDRFSTGIDVWNAATNDQTSDERQQSKRWRQKIPSLEHVASFTKAFVTNTVIGMAVFATYESTVDHFAGARDNTEERGGDMQVNSLSNTSIPLHILAGGLGGASHAILSLALDTKISTSYITDATNQTRSVALSMPRQLRSIWRNVPSLFATDLQNKMSSTLSCISFQYPTLKHSLATIFHHSLAHSMLFGSYQSAKWISLSYVTNESTDPERINPDLLLGSYLSDANKDVLMNASAIACSGGIAGQLQHLTSHLTEQYFNLSTATEEEIDRRKHRVAFAPSRTILSLPSSRSIALAFPPSAIGFLAYEYGKMLQ